MSSTFLFLPVSFFRFGDHDGAFIRTVNQSAVALVYSFVVEHYVTGLKGAVSGDSLEATGGRSSSYAACRQFVQQ
jgi:hypothetical protein